MTAAPTRSTTAQRMILTCYTDTFGYGWRHVDLFTRDSAGRELNWVHWFVAADGPDAADAATASTEPTLRRTTPWHHHRSAAGMDYWEAEAEWVTLSMDSNISCGEYDRSTTTSNTSSAQAVSGEPQPSDD